MGLVVQAPADALLSLPAATNTPATGDAAADTFAGLLVALAGDGANDGGTSLADALLGAPATAVTAAKPGPTKDDTDPLAASLAASMLLQFQAPSTGAMTTIAVSLSPGVPAIQASDAPAEGDVAEVTPRAEAPADATASAIPASDIVPFGATNAAASFDMTAALRLPSGSVATSATTVAAVDLPVAPAPAEPAKDAVPVALSLPPAAPPEAPPADTGGQAAIVSAISVVRSVGNAQQGDPTGDQPKAGGEKAPKAEAAPVLERAATAPTPAAAPVATSVPSAPADGPAPATEAPSTPPVPVAEQVSRAIIQKVESGGGEVRIRLDPPELGSVTIHIRTEGDRVQVQVQAERSEAMNLLRQHTIDLSSLLGSRGLDLTDVYVGLGGRQAPGSEQFARPNNDTDGDEFASILGIDAAAPVELHNRLRSAYNPDGRHIYRV